MDEPFSALDALSREALQDLLLDLLSARRMTALVVTHSIEEAAYLQAVEKTIDQLHAEWREPAILADATVAILAQDPPELPVADRRIPPQRHIPPCRTHAGRRARRG